MLTYEERGQLDTNTNMPSKKRVKKALNAPVHTSNGPVYHNAALPAASLFGSLPYDVRHQICRSSGLSPIDLLHLSHTNKAWYECASVESLFSPWYKVLFISVCNVIYFPIVDVNVVALS